MERTGSSGAASVTAAVGVGRSDSASPSLPKTAAATIETVQRWTWSSIAAAVVVAAATAAAGKTTKPSWLIVDFADSWIVPVAATMAADWPAADDTAAVSGFPQFAETRGRVVSRARHDIERQLGAIRAIAVAAGMLSRKEQRPTDMQQTAVQRLKWPLANSRSSLAGPHNCSTAVRGEHTDLQIEVGICKFTNCYFNWSENPQGINWQMFNM